MESRRQGLTLFTGIAMLIGLVVVVQLWLLQSSIAALETGAIGVVEAAAGASLVLFAINGGLLLYVTAFDRRLRGVGEPRSRPHP